MDKPRHPHVVRTWTVERTRVPVHGPGPKSGKLDPQRGTRRRAPRPRTEPRP